MPFPQFFVNRRPLLVKDPTIGVSRSDTKRRAIDGRIELKKAEDADKEEILLEVRRYCPDLQQRESDLKVSPDVYVREVSFYKDYRLVALQWKGEEEKSIVGFYAEGDFRPLDRSGDAIRQLNAIAPLQLKQVTDDLTRDAVLSYVLLRLACERLRSNKGQARLENDFETTDFLLKAVTPKRVHRFLRRVSAGHIPALNNSDADSQTHEQLVRDEQLNNIRRELCFSAPSVEVPPENGIAAPLYRVSASRIVVPWRLERVYVIVDGDGELTGRRQAEITLALDEYLEPGYRIRANFTPRLETSPAVRSWLLLGKEDEPGLLEALKKFRAREPNGVDALGGEGHDDRGETLLRKADFGDGRFYTTFDLIELVANWPGNPRRRYALVRHNSNGEFEVHPLDTTSAVIHDVNDLENLELDNHERREAYLRFFCWAMHVDDAPFLIPLRFHDVRYAIAAGRELREAADDLRDLNYDVSIIRADEAADTTTWRAVVLHGRDAFAVEFTLYNDGKVQMDEMNQVAGGLALRDDRYGHQVLVAINGDPSIHSNGEKLPDALQHSQREDEADRDDAIEIRGWDRDVGANRSVADTFGTSSMRIEGHTFTERLQIDKWTAREFYHCTFEKGVAARDRLVGVPLTFEDCTFDHVENDDYTAIDFTSAVLGGLRLTRCLVYGRIYAPSIHITGNVRIDGCNIVPRYAPKSRFEEPESKTRTVDDVRRPLKSVPDIAKSDEPLIGVDKFDTEPVITFDRAVITGDFAITAVVGKQQVLGASPSEAFARSNGSSHPQATSVYGAVTMKRIEVEGTTSLFGCWVGGEADLSRGHFKRGLQFWCREWKLGGIVQFRADGRLLLTGAHVGDPLDLTLARIGGNLKLDNTIVAGSVTADLTLVSANIDGGELSAFLGADFADLCKHPSLRVEGGLDLTGARVGAVEFAGIQVDGAVRAKGGKFGRFSLAAGVARNADGRVWIRPSAIGAIDMSQLTVTGDVDLAGLQIILPERRRQRSNLGKLIFGCTIVEATIGGNLTFSNGDPSRAFARRWRAAEVNDEPVWSPSRVQELQTAEKRPPRRGKLRAGNRSRHLPGNPTCEDIHAQIWGGLDLHGNKIGGELNLQNMHIEGPIELGDTTVARDVRIGATYSLSGTRVPMLETSCTNFNAEMFRCHGDTDLTGLCSDEGIHARGAIVKGDLLLVPRREERQRLAEGYVDACWYAHITNGGIDLTATQADRLTLSGDNVPDPDKNKSSGDTISEKNDVNLERGQFNLLEIVDPTPGKINLSQMSVGGWEFGGPNKDSRDGSSDSIKAKAYCDVLTQMDPFDRSVWINVENRFREIGLDSDANKVYRKMRMEVRNLHPVEWRRLIDWRTYLGMAPVLAIAFWLAMLIGVPQSNVRLLMVSIALAYVLVVMLGWRGLDYFVAVTTSYGTQVWRPMILWVALFIISASIFSDARNVRVATNTAPAIGPPGATATGAAAAPSIEKIHPVTAAPLGKDWTLLDGLALAIRYQVPIIHIDTHHRWEASERQVLGYTTAEHWAFFVSLLSWLVLPVFLIAVAAKAVRGVRH